MNLLNFIKKFIPNQNSKKLKPYYELVKKIVNLKDIYANFSDLELRNQTKQFKARLHKGETLDDILIEAFAAVRETSKRVLGLYHFEEQLLAGIALHNGKMVEMKTGEGKTLAATLPAYLNALSGNGVHIATVNDYLAKRDADEMGRIFRFLELTCGCVLETFNDDERRLVYSYDIVYSTGAQLGFDYLRDNLKYDPKKLSFRGFNFVIIDEADKLIDDGRTPLIISSEAESSMQSYSWIYPMISVLEPADYELDVKSKNAILTENGIQKLEEALVKKGIIKQGEVFYTSENLDLVHGIYQCLRAFTLYKKDIDYIVRNKEVMIIDEMTGRILDGRRYSEGLHQALEAKEKVRIQNESVTSAVISYQKFFCLYKKIAGMSGTCMSEAEEFEAVYKCDVVAIPTHKPVIRTDLDDELYRTFEEKFAAIVKEVQEAHAKNQPILLITGSVESSYEFSVQFNRLGLKHSILNAKEHEKEAEIIAQAGMPGAITIATNMAGRGTDIQLGGNLDMQIRKLREKGLSESEIEARKPFILQDIQKNKQVVIEAGGLYVIGTERNESRRVDDQARGRAGRQGDPGKSKFMISLDDPLMRKMGNIAALKYLMASPKLGGVKYGQELKDPRLTKRIKRMQADLEAMYFDDRSHMLKYDEVLNSQRNMVYEYRNRFLHDLYIKEQMEGFLEYKLNEMHEQLEKKLISAQEMLILVKNLFDISLSQEQLDQVHKKVIHKFNEIFEHTKMKFIFLYCLDELWKDHLTHLQYLRQVVRLKSYAQQDPLIAYQKEAYMLFELFLDKFKTKSIENLFHGKAVFNFSNLGF